MVVGSTLTTFDAFLKDNYTKDEVARTVNETHTFLDSLDTGRRGTGRRLVIPIVDTNPQGLAAIVADAQTAAEQSPGTGGNIQGTEFLVTWGDYSAHVDIGDKVMAASASDLGAFFEDKKEEIDGLYRAFGDVMSSYMLRDSGHSLGSTTTISTGVVTLTNKADIVNFEVGMLLVASANDGTSTGHSLIGAPSIGYVISVNYGTGSFTVSTTSGGTAGTPTSWTGTMYFFRNSDFGGGSSPNVILKGFGAWNPASDPSGGESFYGVDRSIQMIRRSGVRLVAADVNGLGLETRLKKLIVRMASRAKAAKKILLHPEQWQPLSDSIEGRGQRALDGEGATFSYRKIDLSTPAGMVEVISDKFMPITDAYAYDPDAIRVATLSGFPAIVNADGLQMLRKSNSNAYEFRLICYPAYAHRDPVRTGRCPLVTPS